MEKTQKATEGATTPAPADAPDELKVVVTLKGRRAIVSVGAPECDPVIQLVEVQGEDDPLLGALACVAGIREEARTKWTTAKRNPAHKEPTPPPAAARTATTTRPARAAAKPNVPEQAQHTLPLL